MRPSRLRRRLGAAAFFIIMGAAGLAMGAACLHRAWLERGLKLRGVAADAEVVGLRVLDQSDEGPTYQVRYRFQAGLAGETYSAHDLLREKDAFLAVTKDSFDEARASGKVPVVYDGNDPWNNSPVRQPGWKGVTDSPWFFFLGGLPFLAVGAFLLLLGFGLLFVRRLPPLSPGP
jgi:hypothetical protein